MKHVTYTVVIDYIHAKEARAWCAEVFGAMPLVFRKGHQGQRQHWLRYYDIKKAIWINVLKRPKEFHFKNSRSICFFEFIRNC